ncbi:hypothetical protein [Allorhodopirellula heiligendammensis]|uniref:Uncharacterized protein n=1 Tax=Allorhodopirellula heiligendammensis TaxID=2714739 RepID=A0A5C6BDE6_9BACT|nr:hypothetical protein [Allorhodopirellula heiligendammensis]TWU09742.1 hypothetical protein Poly21_55470 [Allorhodopirellula heiligendammensis]
MSRVAIVVLLVAFVVELGTGVWLYREREAVTQAENVVVQRESSVSSRETKATERETANQSEAERLSVQEDGLEAKDANLAAENARLVAIDRDQTSKSNKLAEKERLLTKREEEDEEDDENQAFALSLVKDTLDRVREAVDRQNRSGGGWPPGAQPSPQSPDMSPEAPAPVDVASLNEQLQQLEARYQRIEQSEPDGESGALAREAALTELAFECAELIKRGSIDSLQIQAVIEVDLELLRDWAVRLGLPEDVVPKNLYELLESSRLAEIELLQVKKVAFLKERNVGWSGLYSGALADAESTLHQIQDAKGKRPADPTLLFAKAILERKISPSDAAALQSAASGEARTAAINLRYAQLLKQQMAIRWWDIGIIQRLRDVEVLLSPEVREQFSTSDVRLKYIDLLSASMPSDPKALRVSLQALMMAPETVEEAIAQFISERYADPIRAAESQAILEAAYASENGEVVTAEDRVAFKEWLAGHLSPGKVYEFGIVRIDTLLGIFSDLAVLNDPRAPHADDRFEVEETRRALVTENVRRPVDIASREARLNSPLRVTKPEPQRLNGILRILVERTGTPELKRAWLETALDGLAAQLDSIERTHRLAETAIKENLTQNSSLEKLGEYGASAPENREVRVALAEALKAVELRLITLEEVAVESGRLKELKARAKAGLNAIPPPIGDLSSVVAAPDWAPPELERQIKTIETRLIPAINAATKHTGQEISAIRASKEVAELSYYFHGERLPHEFSDGEVIERFRTMSKEERILEFASVFRGLYGDEKIAELRDSLRAAKYGTLNQRFAVPEFRNYVDDGAVFMGKDSLGREFYRINGAVRVLHNVEGGVMNCPVYIAD